MEWACQIEKMDSLASIFDNIFALAAVISAAIAGISIIMERRRHNRKNLNKTGFMPWNLISVIATLGTVMFIALAIKMG
jgi:acid phosphatase family membrane protein YuiD